MKSVDETTLLPVANDNQLVERFLKEDASTNPKFKRDTSKVFFPIIMSVSVE